MSARGKPEPGGMVKTEEKGAAFGTGGIRSGVDPVEEALRSIRSGAYTAHGRERNKSLGKKAVIGVFRNERSNE